MSSIRDNSPFREISNGVSSCNRTINSAIRSLSGIDDARDAVSALEEAQSLIDDLHSWCENTCNGVEAQVNYIAEKLESVLSISDAEEQRSQIQRVCTDFNGFDAKKVGNCSTDVSIERIALECNAILRKLFANLSNTVQIEEQEKRPITTIFRLLVGALEYGGIKIEQLSQRDLQTLKDAQDILGKLATLESI